MAGFRVQAVNLVNASWGMHTLNETTVETALALLRELDQQKGMAGDDDAGHAFRQVYQSAAVNTVDQIANAADIIGKGSRALLKTAREFLAAESKVAAEMLGRVPDVDDYPANGAPDCAPAPKGRGQELPEVVGETGFVDQFVFGDRFRGDSGKARTVSETWRKASRVLERVLADAQECWRLATEDYEGESADAISRFFTRFVGHESPPAKASEDHTLLANLPAACTQLANACEKYAHHIDAAITQIQQNELDPLYTQAPGDTPKLGGNE